MGNKIITAMTIKVRLLLSLPLIMLSSLSVATELCPVPSPFAPVQFDVNTHVPAILGSQLDHASVSVVNLWANWCAPCRKELPMLNTVQQAMATEFSTDAFSLSLLHVGPLNAASNATLEQWDIAQLNQGEISDFSSLKSLGLHGLPVTLVAQHGQIRYLANGYLAQPAETYQQWLSCLTAHASKEDH